ncbi:probable trafficking protein particle complex subunit 11 at N-terminal half [Coccomyxa sp. Obi]|nr:probable trafficking protein particle complex subunit 11 at N-terminal half [Coccomyxa sp. Obi]
MIVDSQLWWVISFGTGEGEVALRRLSRALFEAAGAFYADDARRRLAVHAERRNPAPAVSVAALAEFRADWASAVKTYQSAYAELGRVDPTGPLPLQRWTELTAVAELIHLKVVTLLLHQQNVAEALGQFRAHMAAFQRPLLPPPPAAAAAHAAWLVRQYSVMGELLSQRVDAGLLPPQREAQPAHFFLGAAHAAVDRRRAAQRARELRPTGAAAAAPAVVPGAYVGQFLAAEGLRRLSEEEYLHFLEVSKLGAGDDLAAVALAKLQSAHELLMASPGGKTRQTRMAYHLGALMAREHLVAQNPAAARSMLLSVAGIYRREGWEVPLGAALLELRECAARLKLHQEHVRHSLELSALRRSMDRHQREAIARAAIATLCSLDPPQGPPATPHSPTAKSGGAEAAKERSVTGAALEFRIRPVKDGLLSALALLAGFQPASSPDITAEMARKESATADNARTVRFGVALWSNIPADLPASSILVNVEEQGGGSFQVAAHSAPPQATATAGGAEDSSSGGTDPILIRPGQWTRTWATWQPAGSGRARVTDVIVNLGPHAAFVWSLGLFPPGTVPIGQPGVSSEELRPAFPPDAVLAGVYDVDVPSSHAAPVLEVSTVEVGIAGEQSAAEVAVSVRGAIFRPVLSVSVAHADTAGEAPELSLPPSGSAPGAAKAAGSALTVPLDDSSVSGQLKKSVLIRLPCSGRVTLIARLNYQTAEVGGEAGQVVATTGITVVDPFQLKLVCSAPARTCPLIVADPQRGEQGLAPLPTMLPIGQPCIAQASLASLMPCDVILRHISVEPPASSDQDSPGVSILGFVPTATEDAPVVFRKGDVHTVIAQVLSQRAGHGLPSGHLAVTWQRSRPSDVQTVRSSGSAPAESAAAEVSEVPPAVVTRIPLPTQDWGAPVLEAAVDWDPPAVVAGAQFELRLRLQNKTHHLVELGVRIGDTSGFVLAGTRTGSASVLPYQESVLRWQLIATASGSLPLPEVHLSAARWAASLQPLAGRRVFAHPPAPGAPLLIATAALAANFAQLST